MARSVHWLIAGGYAALLAGWVIGGMLPQSRDELGIGNSMSALVLGIVVGILLLLAGLVRGVKAIVRTRDQVRWYDYLVLALGIAPVGFLVVAPLLPG